MTGDNDLIGGESLPRQIAAGAAVNNNRLNFR